MGEIADMIIEGDMCQECGVFLEDGCGFPQSCAACGGDAEEVILPTKPPKLSKEQKAIKHAEHQMKQRKAKCPICQRKVKEVGLFDHMQALHPGE